MPWVRRTLQGLAGAALALAGAARAGAAEPAAAAWSGVDFDLARDCETGNKDASHAAASRRSGRTSPFSWNGKAGDESAREKLGPHWSYQPNSDGPVLEFAALGAGRKGRPKLVHLALGWDF